MTLLASKQATSDYFSPKEHEQVAKGRIPHHLAIIMDGNRRWARHRSVPLAAGHLRGAQNLHQVIESAGELGIGVLTVYAFSTENWNRPKIEVEALFHLFRKFLEEKKELLIEKGVRLCTIGDVEKLPKKLLSVLDQVKEATAKGDKMDLVLAMNYGSRDEIKRAMVQIANDIAQKKISPNQITEELICGHLDTAPWPDPDLLIRPSGESRLSNFLLWQLSYTEIFVTDVLWPDFSPRDLFDAIINYQHRESRIGR